MFTISNNCSQDRLDAIKKSLSNLLTPVEAISKHWESDQSYIIIAVLLQNAAHNGKNCCNVTLEKEIARTNSAIKAIDALCKYNSHHFTLWIKEEIDSAIQFSDEPDRDN